MNGCIMCGNNPIVEHNHCEICLRQKAGKLKSLKRRIEEADDMQRKQMLIEEYNQIASTIGLSPLKE